MGQNVEDLALICKSTFGQFQDVDMDTVPIEWNEDKYQSCSTKKLRIGYNFDNEFCEPCPAIKNAMMETVEKLKARGHTLIEIKHDFTTRFLKVGLSIMCPYGIGNSVRALLKGEKPDGYHMSQVVLSYFPRFLQLTLASVLEFFGQRRFSQILRSISSKNLSEFYDNVILREWLKDDYTEMWESNKLDGLISPVLPFTAIKHGHSEAVSSLIGGTLIYNLVGAPAGVVPVRRVRKDEQYYEPKLKDIPARVIKHNTKDSEGLPVAIQVAGMTFQDEKCLGIMKEIEECFDYHERQKI
jgi:Asp-tRNA(Asn)/Glu-tRNA(Gln) amidotransferase A subunit family amidase